MEYGKKFIIIGPQNALSYKEIFPLIKNNQLWLGGATIGNMAFKVPSFYEEKSCRFWIDENGQHWRSLGNACWFTNLEHDKRHRPLDLYKHYSNEYKHYDNYDAIEVGKVCEIPMDYDGVMGVPITFLDKYCPEQFEIVGCFNGYKECDESKGLLRGEKTEYFDKNGKIKIWTGPTINKKTTYFRILIRHRK